MIKRIEGFPQYGISSDGFVFHIENDTHKTVRIKDDYCFVGLSVGHKKKWVSLHRLVALHFIPNPENKPEVNHKDGIKTNCHYSNLEWATKKRKCKARYSDGTYRSNYKTTSTSSSILS